MKRHAMIKWKGRLEAKRKHLERNEGYFRCICEALGIDHQSKLTEILNAIVAKDEEIAELREVLTELCEQSDDLVSIQEGEYYHRCHTAEDVVLPVIEKARELLTKEDK